MVDIFKDLGASMKGGKSVFNFLRDEDLKILSAFFESKNILAPLPPAHADGTTKGDCKRIMLSQQRDGER